jgi:hypothetical protein
MNNNISPRTLIIFGRYKDFMFEDIHLINSRYCQWVINQYGKSKNFKELQEYLLNRDYYIENFYKNKIHCNHCNRYLTYNKTKLIYETNWVYSKKFIKELQNFLLDKIKEIGIVNNIMKELYICKFCKLINNNKQIVYINEKCYCGNKLIWELTNKYGPHIDGKYCLKCNLIYFSYERYPTKKLKIIDMD